MMNMIFSHVGDEHFGREHDDDDKHRGDKHGDDDGDDDYDAVREVQLEFYRWSFAVAYVVEGALLSSFLIAVTQDSFKWFANSALDIMLTLIFLVYCQCISRKRVCVDAV